MWGSASVLSTIGNACIYVALGFGIVAAFAGALGAITSNKANEITTRLSNERIARADERAAEANARAQEAGERAEKANAEAGRANNSAALLERRAAEIRLEAEQLKQAIAWREISPQTRARMVALAKTAPSSLNVVSISDPEAQAFARQIVAALRMSGWNTGTATVSVNGTLEGLIFDLGDTSAAEAIFRGSGLSFQKQSIPWGMTSSEVVRVLGPTLLVGSKPR